MPRKSKVDSLNSQKTKGHNSPFRVLVVDQDPQFRTILERCNSSTNPMTILYARSLAEARKVLSDGVIDLAVIDSTLPDGSGVTLADELSNSRKITQTILVSEKPSLEVAIQAIRAGASDFIIKPLNLTEINDCVHKVLSKQKQSKEQAQRMRRLQRLCKKLNQARIDVSKQVDILCNDLVTAYQELACQMQHMVQTTEYSAIIRDELDLEQLLRKTLEYLIQKTGPCNAAIFLPASMDEFSLGGYVNYDRTPEAADMLLQHLADILAPRLADYDDVVHLTNDVDMEQWIGSDTMGLAGSELVAFGCHSRGEALAIMALFRDQHCPFDSTALDTCSAIGPLMGEALAKLIRIHHRHLPDDPFETDDDEALPF